MDLSGRPAKRAEDDLEQLEEAAGQRGTRIRTKAPWETRQSMTMIPMTGDGLEHVVPGSPGDKDL